MNQMQNIMCWYSRVQAYNKCDKWISVAGSRYIDTTFSRTGPNTTFTKLSRLAKLLLISHPVRLGGCVSLCTVGNKD